MITVAPNPRRFGAEMGGPSRSVQLNCGDVANGRPADIYATAIRRERPVFAHVGRKFAQCKTDRLGGGRIQTQLWAVDL